MPYHEKPNRRSTISVRLFFWTTVFCSVEVAILLFPIYPTCIEKVFYYWKIVLYFHILMDEHVHQNVYTGKMHYAGKLHYTLPL